MTTALGLIFWEHLSSRWMWGSPPLEWWSRSFHGCRCRSRHRRDGSSSRLGPPSQRHTGSLVRHPHTPPPPPPQGSRSDPQPLHLTEAALRLPRGTSGLTIKMQLYHPFRGEELVNASQQKPPHYLKLQRPPPPTNGRTRQVQTHGGQSLYVQIYTKMKNWILI